MRPAGRWQAEVRLQPRQAFRLRASRDRADRHAGWFSIGLRSHGRQHLGQDDTEGVPGQDRKAIWQGQAHLGDGSRHSDRGRVGRDAEFRTADPLSGRLPARTAHPTREGVFDQTVGGRARERAGQTDRARGRDICSRPQPRPARQGAIDAAAAVEKTDQAQRENLTRDELLLKLGAAKKEAGKAYALLVIHTPTKDQPVTSETFHFVLDRKKLRQTRRREGGYLLRSNIKSDDPGHLWRLYLQLVEVEQAFKELKSDLSIRPIYHQLETRIEAHIFIAFLAYCLLVTLKQRVKTLAPGLTARAVLEKLAAMQMIDVELPTTDDRVVVMSRYTEPEKDQLLLLRQLRIQLPAQPPPKITARNNREVA